MFRSTVIMFLFSAMLIIANQFVNVGLYKNLSEKEMFIRGGLCLESCYYFSVCEDTGDCSAYNDDSTNCGSQSMTISNATRTSFYCAEGPIVSTVECTLSDFGVCASEWECKYDFSLSICNIDGPHMNDYRGDNECKDSEGTYVGTGV